jgi:hypothetical protein
MRTPPQNLHVHHDDVLGTKAVISARKDRRPLIKKKDLLLFSKNRDFCFFCGYTTERKILEGLYAYLF